ncbi:MAG: aldose 1-epimerase family protein [Anaerolineales bacterium]|nr:aldose 1-epimerase family protein [Anaerolineales bacterium]
MITLYHRRWSREELEERVGHMDQLAGIRLVESADGRGKGSRLFEVWTGGGLSFTVNAERALDVTSCRYKDVPLAWASPSGYAHPAFYEPEGLGWLRTFAGGLLATCGLDQFGAPSVDEGEPLGLHGRISNTPGRYVNYKTYWTSDRYMLEISGEMRQARLFGENLVLRRRIITWLGSRTIRFEDIVTNEGFASHPHLILYHFNLGFPLVSEVTRLALNAERSEPRDADAEVGFGAWDRLQAPTAGYKEQVFHHVLRADDEGRVQVEVENRALGLGLRFSYEKASLPHLFEWKMMGQGAYVLGIEPGNSSGIGGRADARAKGDLPMLEPGDSRHYVIDVEVVEYT